MSIERALKTYTNPEYSVERWVKNNILTLVFRKGFMSYAYSCVSLEKNKIMIFPINIEDHHEFPLIFNTDIFQNLDKKVFQIRNDLNFMNTFCFGKETSFDSNTLQSMLRKIKTMNGDFLEYAVIAIVDNEVKFLIKFAFIFDIETGDITIQEEYQYYSSDGTSDIRTLDWEYFKTHFVFTFAAAKIEKSLNNILLSDAPVVQMINL